VTRKLQAFLDALHEYIVATVDHRLVVMERARREQTTMVAVEKVQVETIGDLRQEVEKSQKRVNQKRFELRQRLTNLLGL
jgi:hypothetical protein